jgi:hypothetical protein
MSHLVVGIFKDTKHAGQAVSQLKEAGFTEDISVLAKDGDYFGELSTHNVKNESGEKGGAVGAVVGGLAGLLAGVSSIFIPGLGPLLVAGPFTALMTATGALAGGFMGTLTNVGLTTDAAKAYEDAIRRGEVLVAVTANHEDETRIRSIMSRHGVSHTDVRHDFP